MHALRLNGVCFSEFWFARALFDTATANLVVLLLLVALLFQPFVRVRVRCWFQRVYFSVLYTYSYECAP